MKRIWGDGGEGDGGEEKGRKEGEYEEKGLGRREGEREAGREGGKKKEERINILQNKVGVLS